MPQCPRSFTDVTVSSDVSVLDAITTHKSTPPSTNALAVTLAANPTAPATSTILTTAVYPPVGPLIPPPPTTPITVTTTPTTITTTPSALTTCENTPEAPSTTIISPTFTNANSAPACPRCNRTFKLHIGLTSHL
ncbi:hypothetical protein SprV_0100101900 [Sparganum proliferum]